MPFMSSNKFRETFGNRFSLLYEKVKYSLKLSKSNWFLKTKETGLSDRNKCKKLFSLFNSQSIYTTFSIKSPPLYIVCKNTKKYTEKYQNAY